MAVATDSTSVRNALVNAQIISKVPAAHDAVTFWLAAPGTQRAPAPYLPGQFITLFLPTSARGTISRSYSLCGDGRSDRPWEITVKRQHGGTVSSYLLDKITPGMVLQTSMPAGNFVLPQPLRRDVPLIFIATGSGITPLYGMLRFLARLPADQRPPARLYYAYRTPAEGIYTRELIALDPQRQWLQQYHYLSSNGHRLSGEGVVAHVGAAAPYAHWYICGSAGLKRSVETLLRHHGVPSEQIHVELFASPRAPAIAAGRAASASVSARIRLADTGAVIEARGQESMLDALERAGYRIPYSCRAGSCGTCRLRVLSGQVGDGGASGLTQRERAQGYVLSCVAEPHGDVVLASAGGAPTSTGRMVAAGGGRWGAQRTAIRWTLAAAAVAFFLGTWHLTSRGATAQAGGNSSGGSSTPTQVAPSGSGDGNGSNGSSTGGDDGGAPTPLPSGSGGISTTPSQPTQPPITSSGTS